MSTEGVWAYGMVVALCVRLSRFFDSGFFIPASHIFSILDFYIFSILPFFSLSHFLRNFLKFLLFIYFIIILRGGYNDIFEK